MLTFTRRRNTKSMGYYQIVTSGLTMEAQEVIDKYHGQTQIEDQLWVMKGDLDIFGIEIPPKLYHRAELKSIKTAIKIFI